MHPNSGPRLSCLTGVHPCRLYLDLARAKNMGVEEAALLYCSAGGQLLSSPFPSFQTTNCHR